jgi:MFS transporter, DHA1 family, multidrug resistance protein
MVVIPLVAEVWRNQKRNRVAVVNMQENDSDIKAAVFASLALAFAGFGDAFLYAFLPVNHSLVGVPAVWVGVLLSINRFVRIISNGIMVHLFDRYGLRLVMIGGAALAIVSTLGYAFSSEIFLWIILRISWGLSFSALRVGTLGYAIQNPQPGFALGIARSLQEAGPMLSLSISPFLLNYLDARNILLALGIASFPAFIFAWKLPVKVIRSSALTSGVKLKFPSTLNLITFVSAILIDGVLIIVLGILFLESGVNMSLITAASLAAFYLAYRRICLVILSPFSGWIADRVGLGKIFIFSLVFIITGMLIILTGWIAMGIVLVFTAYSIHAAVTPGAASINQSHSLSSVAENTTWRDIGAGLGTLIGGMLISSALLNQSLFIITFVLLILLLIHCGNVQKALKLFYLWK